MDPVHDRGSMDPVHESGPWTRSKVGVHGSLVHVLSLPLFSETVKKISKITYTASRFSLLTSAKVDCLNYN